VSVAAVVVDECNRVLVVQRRDDGTWQPPGGVLELHETLEEGLVREVREETGHIVEPDETIAVSWMTREQVIRTCNFVFAVRVLDALDDLRDVRFRNHDGRRLLTA
jgi:8-oxo-dGTP pyrophosphatase MutT (NUDIX family)